MNNIYSYAQFGFEGSIVHVETDVRRGIPSIDMVGYPFDLATGSRNAFRAAAHACGLGYPTGRIIVSLSPADVHKDTRAHDLAIALGIINSTDGDEATRTDAEKGKILALGRLSPSGALEPVHGVRAAVSAAHAMDIDKVIVPESNFAEASFIPGMKVASAGNLSDAQGIYESDFMGVEPVAASRTQLQDPAPPSCVFTPLHEGENSFSADKDSVEGLVLAIAGRANVLIVQNNDADISRLCNIIPLLQPLNSFEKAQPVARINSLAGCPAPDEPLRAPFRHPHDKNLSLAEMAGGGVHCSPGEISLAHNGILCMESAADFRESVLKMLGVPLVTGTVTLSDTGTRRSTVLPADYRLVMTADALPDLAVPLPNPDLAYIKRYWERFGEALLARVQINVDDRGDEGLFSVAELRERIRRAQNSQYERQGKLNGELEPAEINEVILNSLAPDSLAIYRRAADGFGRDKTGLYARNLLVVSRTVADMDGRINVTADDMDKARSFVFDRLERIDLCRDGAEYMECFSGGGVRSKEELDAAGEMFLAAVRFNAVSSGCDDKEAIRKVTSQWRLSKDDGMYRILGEWLASCGCHDERSTTDFIAGRVATLKSVPKNRTVRSGAGSPSR